MGEKCERCGRLNGPRPDVAFTDACYVECYSEAECDEMTATAEIDCTSTLVERLTAEVATLRARLEEADARWRACEAQHDGFFCTGDDCSRYGSWSTADREYRCPKHTTNEEAKR